MWAAMSRTFLTDVIHNKRAALIGGLILISLGLLLNEWLLTALLSPDGSLERRNIVIIWLFDAAAVGVGLFLIVTRTFARLLDLAIGLALTALMLWGAESFFYRLNHPPPGPTPADAPPPLPPVTHSGEYTLDFFRPDPLLGHRPRPSAAVDSLKKIGEETLYDVVYTIDEHQRRVTPLDSPETRSRFILFFGGSFTFGEGLNDDETLPYYVGRLAPDYQPYNYGLSGYGPQQMLAKLQSDELTAEIPQTEGIAIFTFIDAHVERAIGSMYVYNAWGDEMPYYHLDWGGNLTRQGNFKTGRPLRSTLFETLEQSEMATYFQLNIPPRLSSRHYAHAVRIIAEARDTFQAKYRSDDFYVVIYPDEGDYFEDMEPHLQAANLKILNYDEALKLDPEAGLAISPIDRHPTQAAHQIVAEWLVADLGIGEDR